MFNNLKQFFLGLRPIARASLVAGLLVILILAGLLGYWSFSTNYDVLFSGLQLQDSASIVSELGKLKIPYRIAEGGREILVPAKKVYSTRLKLMGKGIPLRGGVGFEIFDKNNFGMTEFAQKIEYQRALQGELARTIMSIQGVKYARVELVLPQTSLFKEDKTHPKGSVSLILGDDVKLVPDQVQGIQRLVASAVPGLNTSRVTIVDQRGVTLSNASASQSKDLSASGKLNVKMQVEKYLESKISNVLNSTFGRGKSVVSVDATLNMDKIDTTEESMLPVSHTKSGLGIGGLVRRRTIIKHSAPIVLASSSGHKRTSQLRSGNRTSEVEYRFGRKVEKIFSSPGSIRRLSVAVLIPYHLDAARLADVKRLVAATVGIDRSRGDKLAVYSEDGFAPPEHSSDKGVVAKPLPRNGQHTATLSHHAVGEGHSEAATPRTVPNTPQERDVRPVSAIGFVRHLESAWHDLGKPYGWILAGVILLGLMLLGVLVLALLISAKRRSQRAVTVELSAGEREALLLQIREWIDSEDGELAQTTEGVGL